MEIPQIRKKIQEKWPKDYQQEHTLTATLEDIGKFPEALRIEFEKFLKTDELPKIDIESWSLENLIKEKSLHPVGAFIILDWLQREPEKAKRALERGFDSIPA